MYRGRTTTKQRELDRLTTLCVRGMLSDEEFVRAKTNLLGEKATLEAQLADPAGPGGAGLRAMRETLVAAIEAPAALRKGTAEERRRLVAAVCRTIELRADGVRVVLKPPYRILAGLEEGADHRKGANPSTDRGNAKQNRAKRASGQRRTPSRSPSPCPAGANPPPASVSSLNERESRACGAARSMTFLAWRRG